MRFAVLAAFIVGCGVHAQEAIDPSLAKAGGDLLWYDVAHLPIEGQAYPDRAARILGRIRELHGGMDYDPAFGQRMTGQGNWAQLFRQRFEIARKRAGLARQLEPLRTDLFRVPAQVGDQLNLF